MRVASIIALGFGIAAATAALVLVGRPAFDRLHRWLDWRHMARMQVRRKLAIHRSL